MNARLSTALMTSFLLATLLVTACARPTVSTNAKERPTAKQDTARADKGKNAVSRSWPMFGGTPDRNMVNSVDKGIPTEWSAKKGEMKNIKWVVDTGTRGYLPPAISGGKIFLATNNRRPHDPAVKGDKAILLCFNEADGKFLWQNVHEMPSPEIIRGYTDEGLCSTPAVEGDRLYYVTPAAEVVCAKVTDGSIVWKLDMRKDLKVFPCFVSYCCPLVVEDLVYVITGNGRVGDDPDETFPAPKAPSFLAINKTDGKVAWQDNTPGEKVMEGQWANPAYGVVNGKPQVIFPGGDGVLYAFEPKKGKLIWKFDCNPKDAEFKPGGRGTRNYVMSPVIYDNKVYTGVGSRPDDGVNIGHFWCIDATKTGDISPEWQKEADAKPGWAKPKPKTGGYLWHFGGPDPKGKLRDFYFGRTISTPAILDGLLYIPELDGFFHCLDAKTGKKYWEYDMKASTWASPLCVDGKIYLPDDQGFCHILTPGREMKLIKKVELNDAIQAPVVVANGVLYITTDKKLYAIGNK